MEFKRSPKGRTIVLIFQPYTYIKKEAKGQGYYLEFEAKFYLYDNKPIELKWRESKHIFQLPEYSCIMKYYEQLKEIRDNNLPVMLDIIKRSKNNYQLTFYDKLTDIEGYKELDIYEESKGEEEG
ncbi:hypothetical protein KAU11_10805, partial [Candidatus Babeliales bacterium]|nr:hypothetical protein [Candidatus Babeliales bacterium]